MRQKKAKFFDLPTKVAIAIGVGLAWFGFVGPCMVSSESTTLVLGYVFLSVVGVIIGIKRSMK